MSIALAVIIVSGSKVPKCDMNPEQHSAVTEIALDDLRKKGYSITEGTFEKIECDLFGSNLLAPYVVYRQLGPYLPDPYENFAGFLLHPGSAVLNIGCTPFGVDYFSYRSYLPFNDNFSVVFASLGDSLNNAVIKTTGDDGIVQGRTAAVITTADATTMSDITAALIISGLGNATNLDGYDPAMIEEPYLQPLVMLHRAHIWENAEEKEAYFAQKRKIYMIEPPKLSSEAPFEPIPERRKGTGVHERSLIPDFQNMRTTLISGIKQQLSMSFRSSFELYNYPQNRTECIINGSHCYGDNSDANYFIGPRKEYKLGLRDMYVIFGTNCAKTEKCTYSSLAFQTIRDNNPKVPVAGIVSLPVVVDYRRFDGSAQWFAPNLPVDVADSFFAFAVGRSCFHIPFCVEIPYTMLSNNEYWFPMYRTVLEPKTGTGAKVSESVLPVIMHFSSNGNGLKGMWHTTPS